MNSAACADGDEVQSASSPSPGKSDTRVGNGPDAALSDLGASSDGAVDTAPQDGCVAVPDGASDAVEGTDSMRSLDIGFPSDLVTVSDGAGVVDGGILDGGEDEVGSSEEDSSGLVADVVTPQDTPAVSDVVPMTDALSPVDASGSIDVETLDDAGMDLTSPKPLYLLSVNNGEQTLEKISVETGAATDICTLPAGSNYPSLTFSRDNALFGSKQGSFLDMIDPCTCEVTPVGSYGGFTGVNGITTDFGPNLFGISHIQDVLITVDAATGAGTSVGPLGVNFGYTGATWSESEQVVYAIDAASDALFKIDSASGAATYVAPLSLPMGTVGIEMHPANGILYACSDPSNLLAVDLLTGEVTVIGPMAQNAPCNNLAAPWAEVPCLSEL